MGEKKIKVLAAERLRALVALAQEADIKKDDVVTIMKDGGQFMMVYYGK